MKRRQRSNIGRSTTSPAGGRTGADLAARLKAEALHMKQDQVRDRQCRVRKGTLRIQDVAALLIQEQVEDIASLTINPRP